MKSIRRRAGAAVCAAALLVAAASSAAYADTGTTVASDAGCVALGKLANGNVGGQVPAKIHDLTGTETDTLSATSFNVVNNATGANVSGSMTWTYDTSSVSGATTWFLALPASLTVGTSYTVYWKVNSGATQRFSWSGTVQATGTWASGTTYPVATGVGTASACNWPPNTTEGSQADTTQSGGTTDQVDCGAWWHVGCYFSNAIKYAFVPSGSDLQDTLTSYVSLFGSHWPFGPFVWGLTAYHDLLNDFRNAMNTNKDNYGCAGPEFSLPDFQHPGQTTNGGYTPFSTCDNAHLAQVAAWVYKASTISILIGAATVLAKLSGFFVAFGSSERKPKQLSLF
jgi:hypothetical protein